MSVGLDVSPEGLGGPLVLPDSAVMSVGLPGSPVSLLPGSSPVGDQGAHGPDGPGNLVEVEVSFG